MMLQQYSSAENKNNQTLNYINDFTEPNRYHLSCYKLLSINAKHIVHYRSPDLIRANLDCIIEC